MEPAMLKILSALLMFACTALAFGVEPEAASSDANLVPVFMFIIATVICAAVFFFVVWKNEQKPDRDRLGDSF
jgi:hypothetical protein